MLTQAIMHHGYWIVAVLILMESAGVPLPGETALLVAGGFAGAGMMKIRNVIILAALSAIVGDAGGYWIGRLAGRRFVNKYGHYLHLDQSKIIWIENFFRKHGPKAVFFGRFIGILRTYAAFFAGMSRMPYGIFTTFNATGGILWATVFGSLGYLFGHNLPMLERTLRQIKYLLALFAVLAFGLMWFWKRLKQHPEKIQFWKEMLHKHLKIAAFRSRYSRQLQWLKLRLTPGKYLGLHLTIGFISAAACLWLLGGLTEDIVHKDPLVKFDFLIAQKLHQAATPSMTKIFILISALDTPVLLLIASVVSLIFAMRREWFHLSVWVVALSGGALLNQLIKHIVHRSHPYFALPFVPVGGYSFPSGHAAVSFIAYGLLSYFIVLKLRSPVKRAAVILSFTLLVILIGFSRLYLGIHYFSDVVAGFAAGAVWLSVCITSLELVRRGDLPLPSFFSGAHTVRLQQK